ncbi:pyridoxamine 5'-phosphate oxidase family protein, partial [Candidatus Bipolaricaulota bacterium]|nr:pyridoxamine 5'-phosphate oxidase family protein [Candidatus Bipolaricaulota bacterium]
MRRQDREIVDEKRIWEILRSADVCRVAFCGEGWPYIIPMNFGILDRKLYFHCVSEGTKLDLLKANANVCFEAEARVEIAPGADACNWSVRYQS